MPEDRMPEQNVMAGARPHGRIAHTEDGTIREREFNADPLAPPWERRQDWTTEGFDQKYCAELDKANGVSGIGQQYYLYPARNPNAYSQENRPRQIQANYQGSFVVKPPDKKGADVVNLGEDLIMMAIPREHMEKKYAALTESKEAIEEGSYANPHTGEISRPDVKAWPSIGKEWGDMTAHEKKQVIEAQRRQHAAAGMVGGSSPTANMPLLKAEQMQQMRHLSGNGPSVEEEERAYREGGRAAPVSPEKFMELMMTGYEKNDPLRKVVQAEIQDRKKTFSMGGAGFAPKHTPNSPAGRAQARSGARGR